MFVIIKRKYKYVPYHHTLADDLYIVSPIPDPYCVHSLLHTCHLFSDRHLTLIVLDDCDFSSYYIHKMLFVFLSKINTLVLLYP